MSQLLSGSGGELISVQISVDPRLLEKLLECLSSLSFPVNPQIFHGVPTTVEFPAWDSVLTEIRNLLRAYGLNPEAMKVSGMLAALEA